MANQTNEEKKLHNTIRFIEAAQELIDETGIENVSIRKIAERAGFHNSTIYLYFKDVNHLIQLASMRHFEEYNRSLSELSKRAMSPIENFIAVWSSFCQTAFKYPNLFYHFFFGKYSNNLTSIMREYYHLFPEKQYAISEGLEDMYFGNNIYERNLNLLHSLVDVNDININSDTIELINKISTSYFKELLIQKCQNQSLSSEDLTADLLNALSYLIGYQNA